MKKILLFAAFLGFGLGLTSYAQETKKEAQTEKKAMKSEKQMEKEKMKANNQEMRTKAKMESKPNGAVKTKADGTSDKRYKENKKLKADGTPDKRYKENKDK